MPAASIHPTGVPPGHDAATPPRTARKRLSVTASIVAIPATTVKFAHTWAYQLAWVLVVLAHVGIVVAYAHEAFIVNYILVGSTSEMAVQLLGLGASIRHDIGTTLIVTNAVLMAWHVLGAVQAVLASLWFRKLVFRIKWSKTESKTASVARTRRTSATASTKSPPPPLSPLIALPKRAFTKLVAFHKSIGVRGKYFDLAFDVRETIEIISQTFQGYSISCLITHHAVLHFVALVLVFNCWSTPFLRAYFARQESKRRLFCLVLDACFDFCCALVIPFLTFSLWTHQVATFDLHDPIWMIRSSTLLQYNLVNSWPALLTTRLPALGLIMALETIKSLLHRHDEVAGRSTAPMSVAKTESAVVGPSATAIPKDAKATIRCISKMLDATFFTYGLVILVLYAQAMIKPSFESTPSEQTNCLLQVRPWGHHQPSCAVVDLSCSRLGIQGSADELAAQLGLYDTENIASLTFANCPQLEMPAEIQQLRELLHLSLYNSTISRWDADAELTAAAHTRLTSVTLLRVSNMTTLPRGLRSPAFPPSLRALEVSHSDLTELPSTDVARYWPATLFVVVVEHSALHEFPPSLLSKTVTQRVSLANNSITTVPFGILASPSASPVLRLGANPITQLPSTSPLATDAVPTTTLHIESTLISQIPEWLVDLYTASRLVDQQIYAFDSPVCSNTSALNRIVDCSTAYTFAYPIEHIEALRYNRRLV